MTFEETLAQVRELLEREGRIAYRVLKRRFSIDDEYIEDLKADLIDAKRVAIDEDGKVLVWVGQGEAFVPSSEFRVPSSTQSPTPNPQSPASYTPAHLAERIRAEQAAMESRGSADGERKTITALFADLKGSTALIEGLDPEEARAIIDPALQLMMDAVHRYDGYVAQVLGDGVFALFGAPIAHEDHPQRALYAALHMQEEMRRYTDALRAKGQPPLLMRVGLNTGEVVVRSIRKDDLHADYIPIGHSTNLAARMEQLAAPGSILVTDYTHKLTNGYFEFRNLGKTQIKGVEEPFNVYEVLGAGPLRTRLQVAARRGFTRFVGRQAELQQLQQALDQAKVSRGQIVGAMGEPGLGKSRLFHEFVGAYGGAPLLMLQTDAVSHGKGSPYLPLIELLKNYFQIQPRDDERTRKEKVTGKVLTLDRSLENILPYLFALLGVEDPSANLQQIDAQLRRQRTVDALKRLFLRESLNQPLVLIFEDLHWVDAETQGFLDVLSESVAGARILLLVNYRPEYRHEWGQKTYYTQLRLAPLRKEEAEEFLDVLLGVGSSPWPSPQRGEGNLPRPSGERVGVRGIDDNLYALKRLILEKTEGTPFFMEEIVQELREQGVIPVRTDLHVGPGGTGASMSAPLQIPATVQGVLAARIDRLAPEEKTLLQQLSVIGREFSSSLIRHVLPQSEAELYHLLSALQQKEFLYEQPAFPEVEYLFKHVLTQEVAYASVLIEHRKTLHEQIAQAIESLNHTRLEDHYSELAHHYSRSRNAEKAIEYLQKAGQQAARHSAHAEVVDYLSLALELLNALPNAPERAQQELTLQLALAASLQAVKGPSAPEVQQAYTRARVLCQQGGEPQQVFSVLRGLWVLHHVQANLAAAREFGEQLLHIAEQVQDSALLLEAHRALGSTLLWEGEFALSRIHLEEAIALYDQKQHRFLTLLYGGADPGVTCLCELARVLWFLGYPTQALLRSQAALTLAPDLSDPFSLGYAFIFAAGIHQFRREGPATQSRAEEGIALAREHGFAALLSAGMIRRGWALAEQDQGEAGLQQMQQGLSARQATGAGLAQPYFLALQAEVCGKLGRTEEALTLISEALTTMSASGEHRLEAELYRLKGELLLARAASFTGKIEETEEA